jgi:hypothetical protein
MANVVEEVNLKFSRKIARSCRLNLQPTHGVKNPRFTLESSTVSSPNNIAMLKTIIRRPVARVTGTPRNRRNFSLISVHSNFPATLYRFQLSRESQLYDQKLQQEDSEVRDAVNISQDGLVYPEVYDYCALAFPPSSHTTAHAVASLERCAFMPNTYILQELTRMSFDYYLDNQADSLPSAVPHFLRIPKGEYPWASDETNQTN